jgi:hypothetical protein
MIEVLVRLENGMEELWLVCVEPRSEWWDDNLRALRIVRDKLGQSGLVHVVGMEARACQPENQY